MRISDWSSDVCSSDLFRAAATAHALYGQGAITAAIISKAASVSDLLELQVLLKEAGLYRPGHAPGATIKPMLMFETIDDLDAAPPEMAEWLSLPEVAVAATDDGYYAEVSAVGRK